MNSRPAHSAVGLAPPNPVKAAGTRILLVEDHLESRKTLARLLIYRGFTVVEAASVAEAKKATANVDHFNLVVSDIGLPDGTGMELMEWLRHESPGLPGIALTAYGSPQNQVDAEAAGFSAHLTKPVNFQTLLQAISLNASASPH